jgi:hypothetical protein
MAQPFREERTALAERIDVGTSRIARHQPAGDRIAVGDGGCRPRNATAAQPGAHARRSLRLDVPRRSGDPRQFARGERAHRCRCGIREKEEQHIVVGEQNLYVTKGGIGGHAKQRELVGAVRTAEAVRHRAQRGDGCRLERALCQDRRF